ncbi:MAG: hypothetical protein L0Y79_04085 [Chlorobi bacterium]|nr:hypothetical protein [Chlorobiota bacterium]MCI0717177.1 hypothetical protein [Chlorobiota bacterium]
MKKMEKISILNLSVIFTLLILTFSVKSQDGIVDNSKFVSQSIPDNMTAGETYKIIVTFENTGTTNWKPDEYMLKIMGEIEAGSMNTWGHPEVNLAQVVEAGNTVSFELKITAPLAEGTYAFRCQMMHGNYLFGQTNKKTEVIVNPVTGLTDAVNSAAFVEQTVPRIMISGFEYKVMITMTNSGKTTWTPGKHKLVYLDPSGNAFSNNLWGVSTVEITENIAPGATKVFNFDVKAQEKEGSYKFQWRMYSSEGGFFGDASKVVSIIVKPKDFERKR